MPADAMGGMSADLVSAIPADALGGLSADMVAAIPADANFVAPTIGTPGFEQFDTAQASDFVVPEIVQPDFPADFVAPTFDPAVGGFQTEAGGPGLTADAFNDPNFVAPTIGEPGFAEFDAAAGGQGGDSAGTAPTFDPAAGGQAGDFAGTAPTFDPAAGGQAGDFAGTAPTFDPAAGGQAGDFAGTAPTTSAETQPSALDSAFAPAAPVEAAVPTFDPVAEQVAEVSAADATQGASQAPEAVVAESAPEPAPAPEAVVDDAPAPSAPEDPIAG
jgi:nicotinate-nucleotide--dimethylbenzimidazole phosphoribosyltransferase